MLCWWKKSGSLLSANMSHFAFRAMIVHPKRPSGNETDSSEKGTASSWLKDEASRKQVGDSLLICTTMCDCKIPLV